MFFNFEIKVNVLTDDEFLICQKKIHIFDLIHMLNTNLSIREVDLEDYNGISALIKTNAFNASLRELHLTNCNYKPTPYIPSLVFDWLCNNKNIKKLVIKYKYTTDNSDHLTKLVETNTTIEEIYVDYSMIDNGFIDALKINTTIKSLDIAQISDSSVVNKLLSEINVKKLNISTYLSGNVMINNKLNLLLTNIKFQYTIFTDFTSEQADKFITNLFDNTSLKSISFFQCCLNYLTCKKLLQMMENNTKITKLELISVYYYNGQVIDGSLTIKHIIGEDDLFDNALKVISKNNILKSFTFGCLYDGEPDLYSFMNDQQCEQIANTLENNHTITELEIGRDYQRIKDLCQRNKNN